MAIILANDGIDALAKDQLEALGHTVETHHYNAFDLEHRIQEIDCLIVRSATKVRSNLIDHALKTKQLKLIIRAGVGIDNIDHEYATANGILVRNTPNSSSDAVAELAIGHMFALARHIYHANVTMRQGQWNKKHYKGIELAGKTLGLVGFGRIARSVAKKAHALGMTIQYHDISGPVDTTIDATSLDKETLLKTSDFISLHIPYDSSVGAYLDKAAFEQMKPGMYLIHTARGGVVDEGALLWALDEGIVAYAALDVFEEEPTRNEALYRHERISLTPHIGASTAEAQARIGQEIIQVIQASLT